MAPCETSRQFAKEQRTRGSERISYAAVQDKRQGSNVWVSRSAVWGLLVWGSSPVWHTHVLDVLERGRDGLPHPDELRGRSKGKGWRSKPRGLVCVRARARARVCVCVCVCGKSSDRARFFQPARLPSEQGVLKQVLVCRVAVEHFSRRQARPCRDDRPDPLTLAPGLRVRPGLGRAVRAVQVGHWAWGIGHWARTSAECP